MPSYNLSLCYLTLLSGLFINLLRRVDPRFAVSTHMNPIKIRCLQETNSLELCFGSLRLIIVTTNLRKSSRRRSKDLPLRNLKSRADIRLTATISMVTNPIDRSAVVADSEEDHNCSKGNTSLPGC
jgi:hypothetical protein